MKPPLSPLLALTLGVACVTSAHAAAPAPTDTLGRVVEMPPVEVSTVRAGTRPVVAVSTLDRAALRAVNWGQDTPMALAGLPGVFAYSDAGNGIGYSYLTVRGFPQRRIAVLVNGVPLNDPQSHEVYWIDHPDLLSATSEVQVQRGVGPALYGSAAIGGTVSIETGPLLEAPHAAVVMGGGSYGTRRLVLEGGSGPLAGGWRLYGRYARIETDGYREQSWSRLWSYVFAAERRFGSHALRAQLYGGPEETHLSYLALPPAALRGEVTGDVERDRRANPLTYEGERDRFFEPHYQLVHRWTPRPDVAFTQTLFAFDGRGFYDERRTNRALADYRLPQWLTTDTTFLPRDRYLQDANGAIVLDAQGRATVVRFDVTRRREVVNRQWGWLPRARFEHARGALTVGGELRAHDGRHTGAVLAGDPLPSGTPDPWAYYDYHPRVLNASLYAREEWDLSPRWRVTADLAWRHARYSMRDDRFDGVRFDQGWNFGLPRVAVSWQPEPRLQAFASWAWASREPAFRDLYDAEGPGSVPLFGTRDPVTGVWSDPLVRPERVHDWELGGTWRDGGLTLSAHAYRMDFRDELVFAGRFDTDLGYAVLANAARSVHQGLEFAGRVERPLANGATAAVDGNLTLGDHRFVEYVERYGPTPADEVRYDGNPLSGSPATLANAGASLAWRGVTLRLEARHAGRVYVDNTGDRDRSVAPHTTWNALVSWTRPWRDGRLTAVVRGFNLSDRLYETTGYMDVDANGEYVPHRMPAAPRSAQAELRLEW